MTTTPIRETVFGRPDDELVRQIIARASSITYDTWWDRVTASGYCAHPIHLTRISSEGTALVYGRCKNRRAAVCPSCSDLYAGDTWHLVDAGLEGGQDIPTTVAEHPAVFTTLTAPSFGPVHSTRTDDHGVPRRCHPAPTTSCPHGRTANCTMIHDSEDPLLGQPLCPDCYDYQGHVLATWHTPQLWHRFTIALRRLMRNRYGAEVRVSFVKVIEMQARGIPHIHAVIRLDAHTNTRTPEPPTSATSAEELTMLIRQAAVSVTLDVPAPEGELRTLQLGPQTDTQPLRPTPAEDCAEARKIAGYLAKYVTKSVADTGLSPHRINPATIDLLAVTEHVRAILDTIVRLAEGVPEYAAMTDWLHTLGYRGHTTTKSRHYSTTMRDLRARRTEHERAARAELHGTRSAETEGVEWSFEKVGHKTPGDRYLALSAALKHREETWAARQPSDRAGGEAL